MENRFQFIDPKQHRENGYKPYSSYEFAAGDLCTPLLLSELTSALPFYPLIFVKYADSDRYQLNALLGLDKGGNLFVNAQGHWLPGCYVPSSYRSYPFVLQMVKIKGEERGAVCFDHNSGLYRQQPDPLQGEQRFFDDAGKMQPEMQKLLKFFEATAINRKLTQQAVDGLAEAQLLVPFGLPQDADEKTAGLFRVDEAALNNLAAGAVKELQKIHALTIAYAQMFSITHLKQLKRLDESRRTGEVAKPPLESSGSIDALLGEDQDNALKFDWSKL